MFWTGCLQNLLKLPGPIFPFPNPPRCIDDWRVLGPSPNPDDEPYCRSNANPSCVSRANYQLPIPRRRSTAVTHCTRLSDRVDANSTGCDDILQSLDRVLQLHETASWRFGRNKSAYLIREALIPVSMMVMRFPIPEGRSCSRFNSAAPQIESERGVAVRLDLVRDGLYFRLSRLAQFAAPDSDSIVNICIPSHGYKMNTKFFLRNRRFVLGRVFQSSARAPCTASQTTHTARSDAHQSTCRERAFSCRRQGDISLHTLSRQGTCRDCAIYSQALPPTPAEYWGPTSADAGCRVPRSAAARTALCEAYFICAHSIHYRVGIP